MLKLSVIMPVYNSEKYLEKTISSVLEQSLKELELICIDDGSDDGSLQILQQYAEKDNRVKIIRQPNRGQGTARNKGIEAAAGSYLTFIDSDDFIEPEMYERLLNSACLYNADISLCHITKYDEQTKTQKKFRMLKKCSLTDGLPVWQDMQPAEGILSPEEIRQTVLVSPHYSCNKIYRTSFIKEKQIKFAPGKLYEDVMFGLRALLEATTVSYVNIFSYCYLIRKQSSVRTFSDRHFYIYTVFSEISEYLKENGLTRELKENFIFFVYSNIKWHYRFVPPLHRLKFVVSAGKWLPSDSLCKLYLNTIFSLPAKMVRFFCPWKASNQKKKSSPKNQLTKGMTTMQNITKIYLFGLLPLIKIKKNSSSLKLYILGIKIITLKQKKVLFFGIPVFTCGNFGFIGKTVLKYAINSKKKRNVILIVDNIFDEKTEPLDGFSFFEYMDRQKDSPLRAYYVINSRNPSCPELCKKYKDKIITYPEKSPSGFRIAALLYKTRCILECGQNLINANPQIYQMLYKSKQIELILTQHGITFFKENYISPNLYGQNIFNKVMVSNDIEREIFIRRGNYLPQNIITNGLFRWDRLLPAARNNSPKSIFVYFTYRRYLFRLRNMEDCTYIQTIDAFINHPGLRQLLEKNNIELNIAQHHSISQRNISILGNIRLVPEEEIGDIKKKAGLLITDFSSMCFDFMIQDKPVIFMKIPDADDCLRYNYPQDTAEPWKGKERFGFDVAQTVDECVAKIENCIRNNFLPSSTDKKLKQEFFGFQSQFCRRFHEYLKQNAETRKEEKN